MLEQDLYKAIMEIKTDMKNEVVMEVSPAVAHAIETVRNSQDKFYGDVKEMIGSLDKRLAKVEGGTFFKWILSGIVIAIVGLVTFNIMILKKETKLENITIEHIVKTAIPNDPNQ